MDKQTITKLAAQGLTAVTEMQQVIEAQDANIKYKDSEIVRLASVIQEGENKGRRLIRTVKGLRKELNTADTENNQLRAKLDRAEKERQKWQSRYDRLSNLTHVHVSNEDEHPADVPDHIEERDQKQFAFNPDYAAHPVDTLRELPVNNHAFSNMVEQNIDGIFGQLKRLCRVLHNHTNLKRSFWRNRICDYFKQKKG